MLRTGTSIRNSSKLIVFGIAIYSSQVCVVRWKKIFATLRFLWTSQHFLQAYQSWWPVSRGCLLFLGTWPCLRICRRSVLPYIRFCNCLLDYGYVLHIVNFVILYLWYVNNTTAFTPCGTRNQHPIRNIKFWRFCRYRTCFRSQMIKNISFLNILE